MTKAQLYQELKTVNHSKNNRALYANLILSNPELATHLLDAVFDVDNKTSIRAAWVLEFACNKDIQFIAPHLNTFTKNIDKIHLDSAIRPIAKICEMLAKAYTSKVENSIKTTLNKTQQDLIIAVCFDYMITKQKVAAKAYGMVALYLLGQHQNWVHQELVLILKRDYSSQSAAYKARAKQIFKKLKINKP